MRRSALICVSLLTPLAACGGGGGSHGSAGDPPATQAATQAPPPVVTAFTSGSAPASATGFSFQCSDTCPDTTVVGSDAGGTVTLGTATNGNPTMTLNIAQGGATINHTFDFGAGGANLTALQNDPGASFGWGGFFDAADGPDAQGNSYDVKFAGSADPSQSLSYVTFGTWTQTNANPTAQGGIGAFAAGNETLAASIPTTAQASYTGTTIGQGSLNGNPASITGTLAAMADFGARTVNGSMNVSVFGDALGSNQGFWNTLTFNSAIANNSSHFAGTINGAAVTAGTPIAAGTPVITTPAMSGPLSGAFYGPVSTGSPAEIGGVYSLSGGNNLVLGAFGGHH